jgi:hypothetical protein
VQLAESRRRLQPLLMPKRVAAGVVGQGHATRRSAPVGWRRAQSWSRCWLRPAKSEKAAQNSFAAFSRFRGEEKSNPVKVCLGNCSGGRPAQSRVHTHTECPPLLRDEPRLLNQVNAESLRWRGCAPRAAETTFSSIMIEPMSFAPKRRAAWPSSIPA